MKWRFCSMLIAGCFICASLLESCASYYHTKYVNADVNIGMTKDALVAKYGQPYSEEMSEDEGTLTEVLSYKETWVDGHELKTRFYFRDGRLVRKTQDEIQPSKVVVKEKDTKE